MSKLAACKLAACFTAIELVRGGGLPWALGADGDAERRLGWWRSLLVRHRSGNLKRTSESARPPRRDSHRRIKSRTAASVLTRRFSVTQIVTARRDSDRHSLP